MELEVGAVTGAAYGEKNDFRLAQRMAIEIATGRHAPELSNFVFQGYAPPAISRAFWSRAAWPAEV